MNPQLWSQILLTLASVLSDAPGDIEVLTGGIAVLVAFSAGVPGFDAAPDTSDGDVAVSVGAGCDTTSAA